MRTPEQRLWDNMKDHRRECARDFHLERIENLVGEGIPDVLAKIKGVTPPFFVELKFAVAPKRATTPIFGEKNAKGMRVSQMNWHKKWASIGGKSYILVKVEGRPERELFLFKNDHADYLNGYNWEHFVHHAEATSNWQSVFCRLRELASC